MSKLVIAIGNTHIKAAIFQENVITQTWQVTHKKLDELSQQLISQKFEQVAIASVVPALITPWHSLTETRLIRLEHIPLKNTYPSLGIDRALVAWGAGKIYGFPILAIDLGTAISITGVDQNQALVGGAILPGIRSQLNSLSQAAALPLIDSEFTQPFLLKRWATSTSGAIQSGVIYGVVAALEAFIQNWQLLYPTSNILLTGGDHSLIWQFLSSNCQSVVICDAALIFLGMQEI